MRILLADDRSRVRYALRVLLEQQPELEIVGEAADAQELLAQTEKERPDLVLLDWDLPGFIGGRLPAALHQICPTILIIALGEEQEAHSATLAAGADAFVSKIQPPEQLLSVIKGFDP